MEWKVCVTEHNSCTPNVESKQSWHHVFPTIVGNLRTRALDGSDSLSESSWGYYCRRLRYFFRNRLSLFILGRWNSIYINVHTHFSGNSGTLGICLLIHIIMCSPPGDILVFGRMHSAEAWQWLESWLTCSIRFPRGFCAIIIMHVDFGPEFSYLASLIFYAGWWWYEGQRRWYKLCCNHFMFWISVKQCITICCMWQMRMQSSATHFFWLDK